VRWNNHISQRVNNLQSGLLGILIGLLLTSTLASADQKTERWQEAIRRSDIATLRQLIGPDVDVNAKSLYGKTALMLAAADGDVSLMGRLISFGADVSQVNRAGGNALMYAAQYGHAQAVQHLINNGAKIDHRGAKGWNALMIAVLKGRLPVVDILLAHRANPNLRDVLGWTPLMRATQNDHHMIAQKLIDMPETDINARNHAGQTALHIATIVGAQKTAVLLIQKGADVTIRDNEENAPLDIAKQRGDAQLVRSLSSPD